MLDLIPFCRYLNFSYVSISTSPSLIQDFKKYFFSNLLTFLLCWPNLLVNPPVKSTVPIFPVSKGYIILFRFIWWVSLRREMFEAIVSQLVSFTKANCLLCLGFFYIKRQSFNWEKKNTHTQKRTGLHLIFEAQEKTTEACKPYV